MNKLTILLLFTVSFFLTGCLDVVEEMHLNRNGSGKYSITIDMSGLFEDEFMKSMIKSSLEQDTTLKLGGANGIPEMDTIIYFKDMPAEQKGSNPEFWNRVHSKIVMSEEKGKFFTSINLDFASTADITYLYENIGKIGESNSQLGGLAGEGGLLPTNVGYTFAKNMLTRKSPKSTEKAEGGEDMEMMKMFLGSANFRTIYHLPGNVKKVTIPNAKTDGKTVTVEASMIDMMDGKANLDGTIRFK
ncbi:MAG TPA: hypothetical protein PLZ12_09205 [Saprospiraceae bacterium]|nr:hypothetical protein [Saprospiraceae bacterium]